MSFQLGTIEKFKLEQQLKNLQEFRSEFWKHSGEFDITKSLGDKFLASCDIDKDPINAELEVMTEYWEKLIRNLRSLDYAVGRCEDRSPTYDALGYDGLEEERINEEEDPLQWTIRDHLYNLEIQENQGANGDKDGINIKSEPNDDLDSNVETEVNNGSHTATGSNEKIQSNNDNLIDLNAYSDISDDEESYRAHGTIEVKEE